MAADYFFSGELYWSKHDTPVENFNKDGYEWEVSLVMDEASQKIFEESGLRLKPNKKAQDEGQFMIRFKRPTEKLIRGELKKYSPPSVLYEDKPYTGKIGNGSKGVVKVEVFNTARGKGHQLEAIKVEELVEYDEKQVIAPDDIVPF